MCGLYFHDTKAKLDLLVSARGVRQQNIGINFIEWRDYCCSYVLQELQYRIKKPTCMLCWNF